MGIADRDYMHERKEPTFEKGRTPKSLSRAENSSGLRSKLWMILVWLSILVLLYKSFLWWESSTRMNRKSIANVEVVAPVDSVPTYQSDAPQVIKRQQQSPSVPSEQFQPDKRSVTKCIVNGKVMFTDNACPTGATASSVTVYTSNVGTVQPSYISPPTEDAQIVALAPSVVQQTTVVNHGPSAKEFECPILTQQIERIDRLARQPQSGQAQDQLSAERKRLRSRQFALVH